jgi:iron complex transport system substrate-binding protein
MRIVSLLPSATEIICAVGLREALVGVTHECDFPASVADLPKVTRTLIPHDADSANIDELVRQRLQTQRALYTLDRAMLEGLRPDLIVTQSLCDVCAVSQDEVRAAACDLPGQPRVLNLEPQTLGTVLQSIKQVGAATDSEARADAAVAALEARIGAVGQRSRGIGDRPRVVVLEWIDPPFSCGHWTPELVRLAGGQEQLGREGMPSRTLQWAEVVDSRPEVLFLACCGFGLPRTLEDVPLLKCRTGWDELPCVQSQRVYAADGSAYFSRPGPRLVDSLEILAHALHPGIHPLPAGLPAAVRALGSAFFVAD